MNWIGTVLAMALAVTAMAASASVCADSTLVAADSAAVHRSLWRKAMDYLSLDGDKRTGGRTQRFSFLGGPYYNTDTHLGVAVMGTGRFWLPGCDTIEQPSNATLTFSISTKMFWGFSLEGTLFTPEQKRRVNYSLAWDSAPAYFWGMGYHNGNNNANKTKQDVRRIEAHIEYLRRVAANLYVGPTFQFDNVRSDSIARPELLEGQRRYQHNFALGVTVEYDTRDLITDAQRGLYLYLAQQLRPKFMSNHYHFATTHFKAAAYRPLWRSATLAAEYTALLNFGNPSWATMAQLGDSYRMRGYYAGRYRDKHMTTLQVELRQHLWGRHGMVLWGGCGNVFHNGRTFKHILPNYGVGYRFAFRRRMNVRLDFGLGKSGQTGFMFNINEAF